MPASEKNIALLANSRAGDGRSLPMAGRIADFLRAKGVAYTLFQDEWPEEFNGYSDGWIVGGDGTLNFFVNHYPGIRLPLAVFNGGTGNDFHWLLYGNLTLEEQVETVLKALPRPIDLGRCNDRYFLNDVGIGFEGEVARRLQGRKKRSGKATYLYTVLKTIFRYRSATYQVWVDGKLLGDQRYLLVDINNGSRAGGGFHIAPESRADDGRFDLVAINALPVLNRLRWLPVIEKGRHLKLPFVHHFRATSVVVESRAPMFAHQDGECFSSTRMEMELLPGRLLFCY